MGFRFHLAAVTLALLMLLGAPNGAAAQPTDAGQTSAPGRVPLADQTYLLGPDDIVEVAVLGRTDFTTRARVASDGTIQLPYLGRVAVANKTTIELSDQLSKALESGGYFAHPIVQVEIASYASRYVIVLGAVGTPGLVPINRAYRVSEILARVGGVRDTGADYVILRPEQGAERRLSIKAMATGDASEDPYVTAGDKLYIPQAEVFYISGQVKAPGAYPLASDMTVRMAIARGGGLTELGTERGVKLTRHGAKVDRVDLDSKLEPGDIVVVGERFF